MPRSTWLIGGLLESCMRSLWRRGLGGGRTEACGSEIDADITSFRPEWTYTDRLRQLFPPPNFNPTPIRALAACGGAPGREIRWLFAFWAAVSRRRVRAGNAGVWRVLWRGKRINHSSRSSRNQWSLESSAGIWADAHLLAESPRAIFSKRLLEFKERGVRLLGAPSALQRNT